MPSTQVFLCILYCICTAHTCLDSWARGILMCPNPCLQLDSMKEARSTCQRCRPWKTWMLHNVRKCTLYLCFLNVISIFLFLQIEFYFVFVFFSPQPKSKITASRKLSLKVSSCNSYLSFYCILSRKWSMTKKGLKTLWKKHKNIQIL